MMWTKLVFLTYMSITVVGQEDDGTNNYLIQTKNKLNRKHISLSTKHELPYKLGEEFIGYVWAECTKMMTVDKQHNINGESVCTADRVQTKIGVYE